MTTKWALSVGIIIGVLSGFAGGQQKAPAPPQGHISDVIPIPESNAVGPPDSHFQQRDRRYPPESGEGRLVIHCAIPVKAEDGTQGQSSGPALYCQLQPRNDKAVSKK